MSRIPLLKRVFQLEITWPLILTALSLLAVLYLQLPQLTDPFRVDGDFRSYYWMNKFQDPSLFPVDPTNRASYINVNLFGASVPLILTSLGYGLLFYAGSFFFTPLLFSKLLAFLVLPISAIYLYLFGYNAKSRATGIALAIGFILLVLASPSSTSILPGLQRSWALSLIVPFIYYLHGQRYLAASMSLLVCVLFYAPMFLLGAASWGIYVLLALWRDRTNPSTWLRQRGLPVLIGTGVIAVVLMTPLFLTDFFVASSSTQSVSTQETQVEPTYDNLWDNPTFQTGGKAPLFFWFPLVGRGGLVNNGEDGVHLLLMLSLSLLILLVRGQKALVLPTVLWCLLWAGLITFILSWLVIWLADAFLLYLPSRYTRVSLLLFLLAFIVWNIGKTLEEGVTALRTNSKVLFWLGASVAVVMLILIFFYPTELATIGSFNMKWLLTPVGLLFFGLTFVVSRKLSTSGLSQVPKVAISNSTSGRLMLGIFVGCGLIAWMFYAPLVSYVDILQIEPAEKSLIGFVETLPKDSLLAGSPCSLDNIPLFAKRSVLINCDLPLPSSQVVLDNMTAYYANNSQTTVKFCQQYGISHLVINTEDFSDERLENEMIFFEPFHSQLAPSILGRDDFWLAQLTANRIAFQVENYYVIQCTPDNLI